MLCDMEFGRNQESIRLITNRKKEVSNRKIGLINKGGEASQFSMVL